MSNFQLVYTPQAKKDAKKIASSGLKPKVEKLFQVIEEDPFTKYPPYEKLTGDLKGTFSRRINIKHRLAYQVYMKEKKVKVIRMWTHYE